MSLNYLSLSQAPSLPDFIFGDRIGSGSYGTVYKAVKKSGDTAVVAIKCLKKASLSSTSRDNLISEISALKKLHHPHIVAMHDFRWDASYIFIIMEYCGGGDLATYLRKHRCVPEVVARDFLQQLASALSYMHCHRVSHLDLKPSNLLLTPLPSLKIADFGFAQHWRGATQAGDIRGSLLYMAPEMVVHGCYDDKADLWSVGVILYECLFGQAPFLSSSLKELEGKIRSDAPIQIPDHPSTSPQCKDLIDGLLVRSPSHRLTFSQFIQHPFLHPPSLLLQAKELTTKAILLQQQGDLQASFDTYCEALQCYVDAIKCERSEDNRKQLRRKVNEHIEKAEELKVLLKSQQQQQQQQENQQQQQLESPQQQQQQHGTNPIEELDLLWQDSEQMRDALKVIKTAENKLEMEDLRSALERYEVAIGVMLKLVKDEPASRRRELLHCQMSEWLTRAGRIKKHLILSRAKKAGDDDDDAREKAACLIQ